MSHCASAIRHDDTRPGALSAASATTRARREQRRQISAERAVALASLTTPALLSALAAFLFLQAASCEGGLECLGPALLGVLVLGVAFPIAPFLIFLGPLALIGVALSGLLWIRLGRRLAWSTSKPVGGVDWPRWWGRYAAVSLGWAVGVPALIAFIASMVTA